MIVHCPHCDARAFLFDHGIVTRPVCLDCDRPLPMPAATDLPASGPMSPLPQPPQRRSRPQPRAL